MGEQPSSGNRKGVGGSGLGWGAIIIGSIVIAFLSYQRSTVKSPKTEVVYQYGVDTRSPSEGGYAFRRPPIANWQKGLRLAASRFTATKASKMCQPSSWDRTKVADLVPFKPASLRRNAAKCFGIGPGPAFQR